jgi:ABC-2 type transport system permease protein
VLVFLRDLKRNFRSWLVWTAAVAGLVGLYMTIYPSLAGQNEALSKFIAAMPEKLRAAFNMQLFSSGNGVLDFYAVKGLAIVLLAGGIYAVQLVAGATAKEESDKTIEFLLSKPVTRKALMTGKVAVVGLYIVLFNVVVTAAGYVAMRLVDVGAFSLQGYLLLASSSLLIDLAIAAVMLCASVFVTKYKRLFPLGVGLVLVAYILSVVAKLSIKLDPLRWLSPFGWADPAEILNRMAIAPVYLVLFTVLTVGLVAATYVFYDRKDIIV